ncbi:unnamed protein product [Medioppia subpectinata]|uniref:Uncharacterized protein n=1 Tax=Medioppia subpectinata TaxID=1979941 RepID=A0A7R9QBT4_9ACAR|nr:unnamed protein product [Medioppia subpectinata]CAG2117955.1 unnamed protein product [Medioppia subpectinata]
MDTKEHFEFHMKGHYDAKYVCPYCAYTGQTIQIIKRHINTEREAAKKAEDEKKGLTEDQSAHKDQKIYKCFGCKVCNKIHDKLEKRCEHIDEDSDNECDFAHDIDYQFKDHLKKHFNELFIAIKDKDKRRDKIRPIVDKFCEELYFENSAKKKVLIEKFHKSKDGNEGGDKRPVVMESDDDWDD